MNAPLPPHDAWLLANQQQLAAGFARLKRLLRGEATAQVSADADADADADAEAEAEAAQPMALDQLAALFGLSRFEREVLLLAAGVEMDAELAAAVAQAGGTPHRGLSFGLALGGLAPLGLAHWSALGPQAPLRRWQLLALDESAGLTGARLRIDERILHLLAGINEPDARVALLMQPHPAPTLMAPGQQAQAKALAAALRQAAAEGVVHLGGDDEAGQVDVAAAAARALGLSLHTLWLSELPESAAEQALLATLWQREAVLLGSALCLRCPAAVPDEQRLARWLARLQGLVFLCTPELPALPHRISLRIDKPPADEQRALWQAARPTLPANLLDTLAAQFRFSAQQVAERAAANAGAGADDLLWQSCREAARARLESLAQRVPPSAGWADLVLPDPLLATLRQIAQQLQHRHTVHERWGFARAGSRGLGLAALFYGDSGVGKTLACEVLAKELALDLHRIDLSAVVSKYIGETEKNLRRVFDAAEDSGAILLFDEADALFGKRSEVKDSHDRYANIEVGYLLQRIEAYRGLAVLTSNQRAALDPAFQRRLRFVLHFPFPDQVQRELIWRRLFPEAMPRGDIDWGRLAKLPLAGGAIRNIVINAAFAAAAAGGPVQMAHLAQAVQQEAAKSEQGRADSHTRGWA